MNYVAVADTHVVLWHLYDDPKLSPAADSLLMQATATGEKIAVSSISLVEVAYLVEKGRIRPSAFEDLSYTLSDPEHLFVEVSLSMAIADSLRSVRRADIPDMPDRIVAATALHLGLPIISCDGRIRSSNLQTIW